MAQPRGATVRFRAIPVEIEAIQWTGDNFTQVYEFFGRISMIQDKIHKALEIRVYSEGDLDNFKKVEVSKDDWLFKDTTGAICVIRPASFRLMYEALE